MTISGVAGSEVECVKYWFLIKKNGGFDEQLNSSESKKKSQYFIR